MSVRLRRLQADYDQVQARLRPSRHISVLKVAGNPPERYEIEYRVRGLVLQSDGQVVESPTHVAEIVLTRAYPHRAPHCKMLTPIFHPNIDPGAICIGDHWAASESLSDLIVRIGQMIAYQAYNTRSPLNGEAARWADQHKNLLPVDRSELVPPEPDTAPAAVATPPQPDDGSGAKCQNCGTSSRQQRLTRCSGGHLVCADCLVKCEKCGALLCLVCAPAACSVCGAAGCPECIKTCAGCGEPSCAEHLAACGACGKEFCPKCLTACSECGKSFCAAHSAPCGACGRPVCAGCSAGCAICQPDLRHHAREIARCEKCGRSVCPNHLHVSGGGVKICDMCGVPCSECGNWTTHSDIAACSACGKKVCPACALTCRVCKTKVCPMHAAACQKCGKTSCLKCMITCPDCGKQVCKTQSHVATCPLCRHFVCRDCLKVCADCGSLACARHRLECSVCHAVICGKCVEICSGCKALFHVKHLHQCAGCGRSLCPSCERTCDRCKLTVCPEHVVSLARGRLLCIPCSKARQKEVMRIVVFCGIGGIVLLILLAWWLASASH